MGSYVSVPPNVNVNEDGENLDARLWKTRSFRKRCFCRLSSLTGLRRDLRDCEEYI